MTREVLPIMSFLFKGDMAISIISAIFLIKAIPDEEFQVIPKIKWYHQHFYLLSDMYFLMHYNVTNGFNFFGSYEYKWK
jgi:hypothetical protein